jgi:4-diphosphocytidyl-2-C-methyl-D-erythritol kinase
MRLRCRAPGKINLCLFVGRPRDDGYHSLVSLIQPVSLADELTLDPADGDGDEVICPGVEGENLAARALALYREAGWSGPAVRLTITKRVPVAGGMGGGSADAAGALRLVAAAAQSEDRALLARLAQRLGSDVDALVDSQRCVIAGVGHRVIDLPDPVPFGILLVPSAHRLSYARRLRGARPARAGSRRRRARPSHGRRRRGPRTTRRCSPSASSTTTSRPRRARSARRSAVRWRTCGRPARCA